MPFSYSRPERRLPHHLEDLQPRWLGSGPPQVARRALNGARSLRAADRALGVISSVFYRG